MNTNKQNINKNTTKTTEASNLNISKPNQKLEESFEEYTEEEIRALDKYKGISKNKLDDEEIYDLMTKFNNDDTKIRKEIEHHLKLITKKGDDYGWSKVEDGKSKF